MRRAVELALLVAPAADHGQHPPGCRIERHQRALHLRESAAAQAAPGPAQAPDGICRLARRMAAEACGCGMARGAPAALGGRLDHDHVARLHHVGHPARRRAWLAVFHRPRPGDIGQRQHADAWLRAAGSPALPAPASPASPRCRQAEHHAQSPVRQHAEAAGHLRQWPCPILRPAEAGPVGRPRLGRRRRDVSPVRASRPACGHRPSDRHAPISRQRSATAGSRLVRTISPPCVVVSWPNCWISSCRTSSVNHSAPGTGAGRWNSAGMIGCAFAAAACAAVMRDRPPCGPAPSRAAPSPRRGI